MSKLFTCALIAIVGLLQYELWFSAGGVKRAQEVNRMIRGQEVKLAKVIKENEKLAYEISDLKYKEEEIENNARSKLGMIKEDEVFYQVIGDYENFN